MVSFCYSDIRNMPDKSTRNIVEYAINFFMKKEKNNLKCNNKLVFILITENKNLEWNGVTYTPNDDYSIIIINFYPFRNYNVVSKLIKVFFHELTHVKQDINKSIDIYGTEIYGKNGSIKEEYQEFYHNHPCEIDANKNANKLHKEYYSFFNMFKYYIHKISKGFLVKNKHKIYDINSPLTKKLIYNLNKGVLGSIVGNISAK